MGEPNLAELAVAVWRLEKWIDHVQVERKMAAKSALRAIKKYLSERQIEFIDMTGSRFDVGLAVSVVNNESEETDEDKLIISEMVKPIVKEKGAVIQYGQVILGDEVKKPKENHRVEANLIDEVKEAENKVLQTAETMSPDKQEGTADDMPAEKIHREEQQQTHFGWRVCVAVLQGILLAVGLITLVKVGNTAIFIEQLAIQEPPTEPPVSETVNVLALSEIENSLQAMNERLDRLDDASSLLLEKYAAIEATLSEQKKTETDDDYLVYVVQQGDTLIKICQEHNVDYYANRSLILRLNDMKDADVLEIGQKLLLPIE